MSTINIKQLAEHLNLSTSTISRAFRGHHDISEHTKQKILAAAKELNYQPNHLASNMRDKKSKTIAVIVPEIANNFFSQAIHGIESVVQKKGYHILIYVTSDDYGKEVEYINHLNNGRVDGVIMSVSGESNSHEYLHKINRDMMPVVFFDRVYEDINAPKIVTNDYDSSFLATEHLIKNGCKKIAYLVINKTLSIGKTRMNGYVDALTKYSITFDNDLVIDCSNDYQENHKILKKAFVKLQPDGVFAAVERLAFATYYAAYDLNINIPRQLKVISFSSLEIAPLLNPSLTTITQPATELGVLAANTLFNILKTGEVSEEIQYVLESKLIERDSTIG